MFVTPALSFASNEARKLLPATTAVSCGGKTQLPNGARTVMTWTPWLPDTVSFGVGLLSRAKLCSWYAPGAAVAGIRTVIVSVLLLGAVA